MSDQEFIGRKRTELFRYLFIALLSLTLILLVSITLNIVQTNKNVLEMARDKARAYFEKDYAIRKWSSMHGGVYVPVDERTPPNPYLSHIPERDIVTPSGKKLTLMNPAYMMRQLNEEYPEAMVSGHITSLKLMRPENEADAWEKKALKSFEQGVPEVFEVDLFKGEPYMRLMQPLFITEDCLKCHAVMGYKVGDIRGGTSVSISMSNYYKTRDITYFAIVVSHLMFWLMALLVCFLIYRQQKEQIYREAKTMREKEALQARLMQSQKMEAIGTLAGGVAHDFNNLLTVINGFTELSLSAIDKNNKIYKNLSSVLEAGQRAKGIAAQLLAFSRKQIYNPEILNLNSVISSLDEMLRRLIGEDIKVETIITDHLPLIKADRSQLEQIFVNLVVNARDALHGMPDKNHPKRITIETGQSILDQAYVSKHEGSHEGPHVFFAVSDNGIGMDEETRQKVFEPFFTTKEKHKGTGLGLSMVYGIVKQNQGSIYLYSEPGQGTTIKIYWPVSAEENETIRVKDSDEIRYGRESILIVEDEKEVCRFAADSLSSLGYKIFTAGNGQIALDLIKAEMPRLDLIITDLVMPELNGKEFVKKVHQILPDIKVIYVSGYTDNHIVHNGLLEEGVNFIQKPYSLHMLSSAVRQILDKDQ